MIDWNSASNQLLLNPRLVPETAKQIQIAWTELIETEFRGQVGILTSGSSGTSLGKLIVLGKQAILTNAESVNSHFHSGPSDVWLKVLPDFHVGGLGIYARAHLSGAKVVEILSDKWQPKEFYQELGASRATLLSLVPTQLFDLIQAGFKAPAGLRSVIIGGGRLEEGLSQRALELGWPIYKSYGFTECSSQIATSVSPHDPRLKVLDHAQIKVSDEGRICVKSRALLTGLVSVSQDKMKFVDPKIDTWFESEDRGRLADDGSLEVFGRTQDFVKIGGEGVSVPRLEDRLEVLRAELDFTADAAVLAVNDDRLGAVIVLVTDASRENADEITARFNLEVAPFERIRGVHFVAQVPRSPLGKLLRAEALLLVGHQPFTNI
jgi:O-succinylbenzoic acid--CoA ligase